MLCRIIVYLTWPKSGIAWLRMLNYSLNLLHLFVLQTRILVTHNLSFLAQVDDIVVLEAGSVTERGSYNTLLANSGSFAQLLNTYGNQQDNIHEEEAMGTVKITKDTASRITLVAIKCNLMNFRFAHLRAVSFLLFKYPTLLIIFSRHGRRAGTGWLSWTCNWRDTSWCGDYDTEEWGQCPTKNLQPQVSSFTSPLFLYSLSASLFSTCFFCSFQSLVFSLLFFSALLWFLHISWTWSGYLSS